MAVFAVVLLILMLGVLFTAMIGQSLVRPLRTLRSLIERSAPRQEQLPFLEDHSLIRPLSDYGQFVHDAFQKEVP